MKYDIINKTLLLTPENEVDCVKLGTLRMWLKHWTIHTARDIEDPKKEAVEQMELSLDELLKF